jgi:hypothetical protein
MSALTFENLEEFKTALRQLPEALTSEGRGILEAHGQHAMAAIAAAYPTEPRTAGNAPLTGELAAGLSVTTLNGNGQFFAGVLVRNKVKYAGWWEVGSQGRHRQTKKGWNRGPMPPGRAFVPGMIRERRAIYPDLVSLLQRNGLVASGDGDV